MNDRAEAARRVARVRAQMAALAEWRRLRSGQELAAIEAARADLDRFAAEAQPSGALARTVLAQAGRLARRHELASEAHDRSVTVLHQAQRQLKTAETVADKLARAAREARDRRDLESLIESFVGDGPDPASLR